MNSHTQSASSKIQAAVYYPLRIGLIGSLLMSGFATIVYWSVQLSFVVTNTVRFNLEGNHKLENADALQGALTYTTNVLTHDSIKWLIVSAVLVVLLGLLPRARKEAKWFLITAVIVIVFCALATALLSPILDSYFRDLLMQYDIKA